MRKRSKQKTGLCEGFLLSMRFQQRIFCLVCALLITLVAPMHLAWAEDGTELEPNSAQTVANNRKDDAQLVTVSELINQPLKYNGQLVEISGEVVGDIIETDALHKWVNLYAEDATVGVYMLTSDARMITNVGTYGSQGTVLSVQGVFYAACTEGHDGELDLHATKVLVKEEGGDLDLELPASWFVWLGASFCLIGLLMLFLYYKLRARRL